FAIAEQRLTTKNATTRNYFKMIDLRMILNVGSHFGCNLRRLAYERSAPQVGKTVAFMPLTYRRASPPAGWSRRSPVDSAGRRRLRRTVRPLRKFLQEVSCIGLLASCWSRPLVR